MAIYTKETSASPTNYGANLAIKQLTSVGSLLVMLHVMLIQLEQGFLLEILQRVIITFVTCPTLGPISALIMALLLRLIRQVQE